MVQALSGFKVRKLRREAGLTQRELSRRAGISSSYLNLIELNKRRISGGLLDRLATALSVDSSLLDGEAERRVAASLDEIAADPTLNILVPPGPAENLVGCNPDWAQLLTELYRAYLDSSQTVQALADRLNRDPFLGESVHRILTAVTAIRAAAEILEGDDALTVNDRERFLSIVSADSRKLSEAAQALAAFFDHAHIRVRSATAAEHVDAFFLEADNYFAPLEALAEDFLAGLGRGETAELAAARIAGGEMAPGEETTPQRRRFRLLTRLSERVAASAVANIVEDGVLGSEEARRLAAAALHSYTAAAILMPYEPFREAAEECRYDMDRLTRRFDVSYEQAAHRLATLRRPGAEGVRFAFMRSDPSGYVTKRLPLPRLPLPRYGSACPLWVIYTAFQMPGATARNFGQLPTGDAFLFFARAIEKAPGGANFPRRLLSVMLACSADEAARVVYGDGIDAGRAMVPIGSVCRLCPREECGHRQEERLIA